MTEPAETPPEPVATEAVPEAVTPPQPRTAEVAAFLAARMCHDFISPASAIVSGLDLLDDPSAQDMREDAMSLIASSARKLADLLSFTRVAFGASASAETFDVRELGKLATDIFTHIRAELDWQVETDAVNKPAARTLLNLAQLAGAALPIGGVAKVRAVADGTNLAISVEAEGTRARLRQEILDGAFQPLLDGRPVQPTSLEVLPRPHVDTPRQHQVRAEPEGTQGPLVYGGSRDV